MNETIAELKLKLFTILIDSVNKKMTLINVQMLCVLASDPDIPQEYKTKKGRENHLNPGLLNTPVNIKETQEE